ncbi:hypothetical protein EYF80_054055 [Liparis tanakae]|uniref:Uncharacterized protein n=1 Tax=Liparis tanakae TaxID=230148 RepID=A0A4Z2F3U2_9TELE|nr:hypothetical protein EYF80_054055 [Liparis tanakae]
MALVDTEDDQHEKELMEGVDCRVVPMTNWRQGNQLVPTAFNILSNPEEETRRFAPMVCSKPPRKHSDALPPLLGVPSLLRLLEVLQYALQAGLILCKGDGLGGGGGGADEEDKQQDADRVEMEGAPGKGCKEEKEVGGKSATPEATSQGTGLQPGSRPRSIAHKHQRRRERANAHSIAPLDLTERRILADRRPLPWDKPPRSLLQCNFGSIEHHPPLGLRYLIESIHVERH